MADSLTDSFLQRLAALDATDADYVVNVVDQLTLGARLVNASDIHLLPTSRGVELLLRIDGVLQSAGLLPIGLLPNLVARLKHMADMVTYRTDIPQEGRIRATQASGEMRVSTYPTFFGEKTVIRFFGGIGRYQRLSDLGMPEEIRQPLERLLGETSGAVLIAGPAGSGKTTTLYACLRELLALSGNSRSLATLEDPIEVVVSGVAQSQINWAAGFDLTTGLRSMLRQDPEVIALGEIRDHSTAEIALQAALTGHLVFSTFHAGSAAGVVSRLAGMGIEPYALSSGIRAIVCQRLVRRLCHCALEVSEPQQFLGLPVSTARAPVGCAECRMTGYHGRAVMAEFMLVEQPAIGDAILAHADREHLEAAARELGMVTLWDRARVFVEEGITSPAEIRRVLGLSSGGTTLDDVPLARPEAVSAH